MMETASRHEDPISPRDWHKLLPFEPGPGERPSRSFLLILLRPLRAMHT